MHWPSTPAELERLQADLAVRERAEPRWTVPRDGIHRIGAVFAVPGTGAEAPAWAAAVLMEGAVVVETAQIRGRTEAPYVPGQLALQRGRLLAGAVEALGAVPGVLLVNATGRDHPRRAGLALHLGAAVSLPTVGVTDRPLVATAEDPGPARGDAVPLILDGEEVGVVLRSRRGTRAIVAHAAWRTDPDTARRVAMAATGGARTPESLRLARFLARVQRARDEGRLAAAPPPIDSILRTGPT